MAKFERLRKTALTNGQHFTFMQAFITLVTAAALVPQKVVTLLALLVAGFQKEDELLKQARASDLTALIEEADRRRDSAYQCIKDVATAWAKTSIEEMRTAAESILKLLKLYAVDTKAQYDEESGVLTNLLQPLMSDETHPVDIQKLGLTKAVQELQRQNMEVIRLFGERDREWSVKVVGALRLQRLEDDKLYDQLLTLIEAFAVNADDTAPYEQIITEWNATVDRYKRMLDRKSKKDSPDDPDDDPTPDPTPTPEPTGTEKSEGKE